MTASRRPFGREHLTSLGAHLRALRQRRGLALRQLATPSGTSVTAIRKIEAGGANPALLSVVAILDALDIALENFMSLAERGTRDVHVSRAGGGAWHRGAFVEEPLSEIEAARMGARMLSLPPRTDMVAPQRHGAGPHFAFVVEGRVRLVLADGSAHELGAGDAIHAAGNAPRVIMNLSGRRARVLCVDDSRTARAA